MAIQRVAIRRGAVFSIALALAAASSRAQQTIPRAQGTTLTGTAVSLPDAVQGKVGVVVVGFSKASQGQVAAWGRRLATDFRQSSSMVYFEVPMLAGAPRLLRGMGSTVPEAQRSHFLPLMEGEAAWRAAAHYSKPDDAYVLLVDGTGVIHWQTQGDATDAAYTAMRKNLEGIAAQDGAR